jgi:WD40 repeat protein
MIGSLSNDDFTLFTHKTAKEKSFQVFRINKEEIQALKTEIPESHYFAAVKDPPGIYAVGLEKLTFLPDNQDTSWQTLILNSFKDNVDAFDGRIINSFLLPASDRIILMSSQFNYTIINTLDNKLEGSGIIGRQAGRTITAVAGFYANMLFGALNYMAVYGSAFQPALAAASIDVFWNLATNNAAINNFRLWNVVITPDERFMYVFEPSSNDVTILNVTNGSVVDIVPAGAESKGISLTPDGRYLWILGRYRLRAVDTETNKVHIDYTIGEDVGLIKGITFIDAKNAAAVLYDKTLQIWDSEKGTLTKTINRLSMAEFMVCTKIP